jgi:FtsP/CotA-like multicopper oxidase with cupredoxin domain
LSRITAGSSLLLAGCDAVRKVTDSPAEHTPDAAERRPPADVTLRIGTVVVDVAKDHAISTIGYNGSVPGSLIRLQEGVPVTVEIENHTHSAELVHWHGMIVPADVDGAAEENSLEVPAHGSVRYQMTPQPSGARFVHSHSMAMDDLSRGTYTGQFGFVYVEPKVNPGNYDREVFLATHEWEPFFTSEEMEEEDPDAPKPPPTQKKADKPNGWEIGYQKFTINGKCLGYGEPVRVKPRERVLFHLLNASATENIKLSLAGHRFLVTGLDGNPVPKPQLVEVIELGTAERVDAIVEMTNPGVWILGTPRDDDRANGMGVVVEYADASGKPRWIAPLKKAWDYTLFSNGGTTESPDEIIPLTFGKINGGTGGFNLWTVNGKSFEERDPPHPLQRNRRYRMVFDNQTDDAHPVHLHRASFELVSVNGKTAGGVMKDVVLVKGFGKVEVDVVPTISGLSLFHCHQQLHMDFGFKQLFNVI